MKAITIMQPWASLIACGAKHIETRSWATKYRGPLAIHAGKSLKYIDMAYDYPFTDYFTTGGDVPLAAIVAIVDLVDCVKVIGRVSLKIGDEQQMGAVLNDYIKVAGNEFAFGDYTPGRYAWILDNVRRIEPIPAKGKQRLWEWKGDNSGR
ncbi:MAG: hypothetical protein H6Q67_1832 [Firmicutes bacterium]|nr:hypothetical protein [Bacillota bacterium]